MNREEKRAARYRAMFRHYPDALTPAQVQEMLGVGRRMTYGLLRAEEKSRVSAWGDSTGFPKSQLLTISAGRTTQKRLEKSVYPR